MGNFDTFGIAVICVTLGVVLTLRGGSAEILGAFFVGIFAGRTLPLIFPEN